MSLIDSPSDEEDLSKSDEEDAYFNYLVDNTVTAAADVCGSTLSDDDMDYKARAVRKSALYAESALKHYNNDEKNKIKYELSSGITCRDILVRKGCFCHVNFTAKGNQQNAEEELFFAELHHDHGTLVPTCVVSLHGIKKAGGLRDSKYDKLRLNGGVPIDKQNCYAPEAPKEW
ncbi:hypothetical protein BS78_07G220000 [Paspalum vaginatum]|nr:hypothetical protein BS78_07G220000 [Paspalum vaginatum]